MLVLGRSRVETVPADAQGRMRVDALPALDDRTIVCIQAGNVNTGAFDPSRRDLRKSTPARRMGPRRWSLWPMGHSFAPVRSFAFWSAERRLFGD